MRLRATQGNSCNMRYLWSDSFKYVNSHHSVSLSYWNPEVCWLTSPMGTIKMIHLSMMTCIIHVYSRSSGVCWLASFLCALDLMKYADLHHPWVIKIIHLSMLTCKSMSTYITQYLLVIEILKYVDLHHPWLQLKWSNWVGWLANVCQLTSPSIF